MSAATRDRTLINVKQTSPYLYYDAYGCALMGLDLDEVPYVRLAQEYGAGTAHWSEDDLVMLNEPTDAEPYSPPTGTVARLTRRVHERQACSACFASLVRALYASGGASDEDIYIGQGWQGHELDGLGVGRCCAGASTCVKGCPPTADAIARELLKR